MTTSAAIGSTSATSATAASSLTAATKASALTGLDANSFMTLMLTQLKNQDPLNPQDPTAFLSQLAQMSTVTGIQGMQTSIGSLSDSLRSNQVIGGTSMVGHSVMAATSTANLPSSGGVSGAVTIPQGTSKAVLSITDASGALVRTIALNPAQGAQSFTWDGTDNSGARAPSGSYTYAAIATIGGVPQQLETQLATQVSSVTIDPATNSLTLNTDLGAIPLANVRSVM
jgi:flagellar basal-body rod modification protein FlgD